MNWRESPASVKLNAYQQNFKSRASPSHFFQKLRSVSDSKMQRSTWRLASEESVHKIDMPPMPRGRPSGQSGWSMEKPAAVFVKKFICLYFAAAALIALLATALWLWYSGSEIIDDIPRAILKLLVNIRMPQGYGHNELAMVDLAAPLESSVYSGIRTRR